MCEDMFW